MTPASPPIALSARDHAELRTAVHAIRDHHRKTEESLQAGFGNALSHAIEAGRKLIYARSLVGRGGWGRFVEQNLPEISGRTERLYRQLAEAADEGRLQIGKGHYHLSISRARELLLSQASAGPEAAKDDGARRHPRGQGRPRLSPTSRIARRVIGPLRAALAEGSGAAYEQLIDALADELELSGYAQEWAHTLEQLFADVSERLKLRLAEAAEVDSRVTREG